MPKLTRYFLRASLLYMLLGFTVGSLLLAHKGFPFAPWLWRLLPIHVESMLIGWMSQFALGVAFWILPRLGESKPRGDEIFAWLALFCLNLGIVLTWVLSQNLGRFLESFAVFLFIWGNWRRLYPPRQKR
ncbi:MAG: hypothetical protein ACK4VW_03685 [Anaerolineales bacterium]